MQALLEFLEIIGKIIVWLALELGALALGHAVNGPEWSSTLTISLESIVGVVWVFWESIVSFFQALS